MRATKIENEIKVFWPEFDRTQIAAHQPAYPQPLCIIPPFEVRCVAYERASEKIIAQ